MKSIKILLLALMVLATTAVTVQPKVVKAEWSPEVIASSAQVRFEAQPTEYDSATNKYKYKFSWLMPKYRAYSFKIDGKMYNAKVTKNGVVETPFWFSPDITYTIDIYPYANGRGSVLAKGSFKAPSVAITTPVAPMPPDEVTLEEEYVIVAQYAANAPELPKGTANSREDVIAIKALYDTDAEYTKFSDAVPYMSKKSVEMFNQIPKLVALIDSESGDISYGPPTGFNIKVFKGKEYGIIRYKQKNLNTNKTEKVEIVVIKEEGLWKFDMVQLFKQEFESGNNS